MCNFGTQMTKDMINISIILHYTLISRFNCKNLGLYSMVFCRAVVDRRYVDNVVDTPYLDMSIKKIKKQVF